MGMDFLVLSFVVVVLSAAWAACPAPWLAGFLLGILESLRVDGLGHRPGPGDQPDHHLPRCHRHSAHPPAWLMGRKGVMEE
jgi:hypothetical protein